jgi:hypothetical protein
MDDMLTLRIREGRVMKKAILFMAATALLLCAGASEAQEAFRLSGSDVAVYNLAGHVELVRGSGADVVVHVNRGGDDAGRLEVEVGQVRGHDALRVIYPDDQVVYPEMGRGSNSTVRVRGDGTFGDGGEGGDRVSIRGSGRGMEAWADIVVEVPAGKSFSVYLAVGEAEARGIDGDILIDTGSGAVVAENMAGSLEVDTGSGSVRVLGMDGALEVDTGSGSVRIEDVRGSEVVVDTGSGRVVGSGIEATVVEVDTGSGSIDLQSVAAPEIILDTGSGSVDVELLQDVDNLDVDTGSGSVTVRAPSSLGAQVEIDTGSGGIDVDFAVQVRSVRRDHMTGSIGDGRGTLRIDTGSGSIRLIRN